MSLSRTNSYNSFKPIPEDSESHHDRSNQNNVDKDVGTQMNGAPNPESKVQELRQLLHDLEDTRSNRRNGSRPSSRCSVRSGSWSRLVSRRSSWAQDEEDDEENQVTEVGGSQKAALLVASQQRLVYTLQDLRHELTSLDEEVNRIRNDVLNSRRFFNAMRGINAEPTWGSSWRRNGSGSSSPSMYSLDNSFCTSDEMDSMARSESSCSFASWRSEAELYNVFTEAEEDIVAERCSSVPVKDRALQTSLVTIKDRMLPSRPSSTGPRGRYRQLGTQNGRA